MPQLRAKLEQYLAEKGIDSVLEPLTPDASTRRYFRFKQDGRPVVACVYPDDIKHLAVSYMDVSRVFRENGLPVAEVNDFDEVLGVIVLEDLGDTILRPELESCDAERKDELIRNAIDLIPRIQKATDSAAETNSIASRLRFDTEKLMWELNYFKIHYFTTFKKEPLSPEIDDALNAEFMELSAELDSTATVLCHRDFHAANLMIDSNSDLRIIDHQDARIGSPTYDLVSLLLDRVTETPSDDWLNDMKAYYFSQREAAGLNPLDRDAFEHEFELQTVQRCLKAAGTFSFQSAARDKTYFIPFIKPMFRISLQAMQRLDRYPQLQEILMQEL
ncbi:MAG TPA: phosphotransferase [Pyrinomonadaceae bacterium]|nr:phosphotransferase [Pyrinomonadaceae bacterium]